MTLTQTQRVMFDSARRKIIDHGTGTFRKDLPKALRLVADLYDETGAITPLHGLVIGAAARRLDEIAKEAKLRPWEDNPTADLAAALREFRHREGG